MENGSLLVVDEIEDSLHPLLTRRLIEMVQDRFGAIPFIGGDGS